MKFNQISISSEITQTKGIKEINLTRLSNVVALVGRNGSGKTRILNILEASLFESITPYGLLNKYVDNLPNNFKRYINSLEPFEKELSIVDNIATLSKKAKANPSKELQDQLKRLQSVLQLSLSRSINTRSRFDHAVDIISQIIPTLKNKFLRRINYTEIQQLQQAINANINQGATFESLIESVTENLAYNEVNSIHKSALKFLNELPHKLAQDHIDCLLNNKKIEERTSYSRFISLKKFIYDFLKKDLSYEHSAIQGKLTDKGSEVTFAGSWKLDGWAFKYSDLSDGERSLLSYALLFFLIDQNPNLDIKKCIILIDEPELHLHPDSEIDLINGIRNAIGKDGQLIFATHSISILSSLSYDEIFMVKGGSIKHPSQSTIGDSLSELMNLEERVHKLSDFLSSIATWTFVNFMVECFSNPEAIESARKDDPQILAFKEAILNSSSKTSNLLLDFGAGKGRLYEQIKTDYDFIERINYSALEPCEDFHNRLKELGANNIYESYDQLPKDTFDFILLCNVLHEIPINEWVDVLNGIIDSLKNKGHLIIIEAKALTKGEKIGLEGFILLDLEEIQILFGLKELPSSISIPGKETTITCAVLAKEQLRPINKADVKTCLKNLETNTLEKILTLRKSDKTNSVGFGRKNAFLSQLHINSRIAQLSIDKKSNKR